MAWKSLVSFALILFCAPDVTAQEVQNFGPFASQIIDELRERGFPGTVISLDLSGEAVNPSGEPPTPEGADKIRRLAGELGIAAVNFRDVLICPPEHRILSECHLPHEYAKVVRFDRVDSDRTRAAVFVTVFGQAGIRVHMQKMRAEFRREGPGRPWSLETLVVTLTT